ncbi:MAG: aspartate aminotransferase family protein [Dehalococcoidia bacterium]
MTATERPQNHLFSRSTEHRPPGVRRAEGVWIETEDGRRILDGSSGALVASIGHGVREVIEAQHAQAENVSYVHGSHFTVDAQEDLAQRLAAMAPEGLERVYPVSGGSEANESAIKLARQYFLESGKPQKHKIIARWTSYHGNTLGALSLSGHIARRRPYVPMLLEEPHIPPCYCYRCPFGLQPDSCGVRCAHELEAEIKRQGPENIAAFIAEPLVGAAGGALTPPPEYFPIIREICDRYDVLFIADEVMTGIGRTGQNFAVDHWNVIPDIITTGKGVGGGYAPLGAMIVKEQLYQAIARGSGAFMHGFTYGGHPPSVAAGAAVLKYVEEHDLVAQAALRGEYLAECLEPLRSSAIVGDIRGKGLMRGIEFVRDQETKAPFPRALKVAERIGSAAFAEGLIIYPGSGNVDGIDGDQLLIGPPLVISEPEIDQLVEMLTAAIDAVEAEMERENVLP